MRFIINIALKAGMFTLFNWPGWLTLMQGSHAARGSEEIIGAALFSALVFIVFSIPLKAPFCLGALSVLLGPVVLWVTHLFAPGFIRLDGFWLTVVCGIALVIVRPPKRRPQPVAVKIPAPAIRPDGVILLDPDRYHWMSDPNRFGDWDNWDKFHK